MWVDSDNDGTPETIKANGCENILYFYFNDNLVGMGSTDAPSWLYDNLYLRVIAPNGALIHNNSALNSLILDPNQIHNTHAINLTQFGLYTILVVGRFDSNANGTIDPNEEFVEDQFTFNHLMSPDQVTFTASQNQVCSGVQVCFTTNYLPLINNPFSMLELDFGDGSAVSFWANAANIFDPNTGLINFNGTLCGPRNTHVYTNTGTAPITRMCTLSVHTPCGDIILHQPITIHPALTVAIAPNSAVICNGQGVVLTATSNIPTATYAWSRNNVPISGATSSSYTATAVGTYTVRATTPGCSATASSIVSASNISIAIPTPPTYCGTGSVTLSPNYNSSTTITSYRWANNANPTVTIGTNNTLSVSAAGTYSVTATNASGCSATAAITIANNGFNVSLPPTATSCGTAVTLTPTITGLPTTTPRTYQQSYFAAYYEYLLKRDLYALLKADSSIATNDSLLQAMYAEYQANNIGQFEELEDLQRKLDERLAAVSEGAKIDSFNYDEYLKDSLAQEAIQAERAKLNGAMPENIIESNQKAVYEIQLNMAERKEGLLTEEEYGQLLEIANQCPLTGGQAVHGARVLLAMQGDHFDFDDRTNCALGVYKTAQEEEELIELVPATVTIYDIVPNPTSDKLTINYSLPNQEIKATVKVMNLLGQTILHQALDSNRSAVEISLGNQSSGIYFLSIFADGVKVHSEKIVKQ